jgi:hypothetical protein
MIFSSPEVGILSARLLGDFREGAFADDEGAGGGRL